MRKDLNVIYRDNRIFYWCNTVGELNMPGCPALYSRLRPEDLPPAVRELYTTYWNDNAGVTQYVATCDAVFGMAVGLLYTRCFNDDIFDDANVSATAEDKDEAADLAFTIVLDQLEKLIPESATLLVGYDADPDGNEAVVFIPQDACEEHYETTVKMLDSQGYQLYESALRGVISGIKAKE